MFYEMLATTASKYPKKTAIEADGVAINYRTLQAAIDHFCSQLKEQGLKKRDPVIILLPNGIEFVVAVFAIAKLGSIAVPVNLSFQVKELQFYLQDSKALSIITTIALADKHTELIQEVNPKCSIVTTIPTSGDNLAAVNTTRKIFDGSLLYQYSSGSTGTPKRVIRSHKNLIHEADNYTRTVQLTSDDRILAVVPMFHAHGFGNCLLATIRVGATMYTLGTFNRQQVINTLVKQKITVYPGVPFMFSILADSPSIQAIQLTKLRLAFSAGAPLAEKTFESFKKKFGVPIRQLYGSTETGSAAINTGDTSGELWSSVGQMQGVEVTIIDDDGNPATSEHVGEVVIRSEAMTQGYANQKEVNRHAFKNGCFWSGDLGKIDANKNLFIKGRKTLFINVGGNKVDPTQVETLINAHPSVTECVVLGVEGSYSQEVVKAIVVCSQECNAADIRDWCHGKIADFKVPRIVEFRDEIPRSPLGKVLRKYLQEEFH